MLQGAETSGMTWPCPSMPLIERGKLAQRNKKICLFIDGTLYPKAPLVHGWDRIKHVHVYSFLV